MTVPILLVGAGGHAVSSIDVIEQEGRFEVAALVGIQHEIGKKCNGYSIVGTDDDLPVLAGRFNNAIVVVGHIKSAEPRVLLYERLHAIGFETPTIVSPHAYVSRTAKLGRGTIVMHGAIINARASVGDNCIINSRALIEHGAVVEDHCHVSTGALVNGEARIGEGTFVGSGSIVRESVRVGRGSTIGMGQTLFADCGSGSRIPNIKSR